MCNCGGFKKHGTFGTMEQYLFFLEQWNTFGTFLEHFN